MSNIELEMSLHVEDIQYRPTLTLTPSQPPPKDHGPSDVHVQESKPICQSHVLANSGFLGPPNPCIPGHA